MQQLINYIKSQIIIDDNELQFILSSFKERMVVREQFVLKQGHVANDYFFIKSGGLRIYMINHDKQVTGWIALENEFFTELSSLKNQAPSRFNIQAIEDTAMLTIDRNTMHRLYNEFPCWQQFGRQVWENAFLKVIDGIISFQTMTAEERYVNAMQQSDLLQRVPLKDLSSYLGITPTSLSRLRKNIK